MEFKGHQFYLINKTWVFDLTTFIGYKVTLQGNRVENKTKAFIVYRDKSSGVYDFSDIIEVPIQVKRKVIEIIKRYRKEALLDNAGRRSAHREGKV